MNTRLKEGLLVFILYIAASIIMTLPLTVDMATRVAGVGGDPWQVMWRFEETWNNLNSAIGNGTLNSLLYTEFLGGGEARLVNLSVWPWLPLYSVFGMPLTFNLIWLLSYILSGCAMYALVRYLLSQSAQIQREKHVRYQQLAAFVAGLMYMLLPYHVAHSFGHFGAMQLQWLPIAILLFLRFIRKPTILNSIGLSIVLTIQAWTEHHYALWFVICAIVLACFRRRQIVKSFSQKRSWIFAAVASVLLIILVIVPYLPTVRLASSNESALNLGVQQTIRFSADPFAYIIPAAFHTLWGNLFNTIFTQHVTGNIAESTQYLGIVPLLLIIFFHQRIPKKQKYLWGTIALIFGILSLGPQLHFFGKVTKIPLPYNLIDSWPVFSSIRTIARTGAMVGLATSVLFGWVLATQVKRMRFFGIIAGLLLVDFLCLPIPSQSTQLSEAYDTIKGLPGRSVVDIPAATNYTAASKALYASAYHGKEVVGNIALERGKDDSGLVEIRSLPALRQLLYLRTNHVRDDRTDFFSQQLTETLPDVLKWLDVSAIAIQIDSLSAGQLTAARDFLEKDMGLTPEEYHDVILYRLPASFQNITSDGVFLARDGRWEHVGFDPKRNSVFAEIPNEASVTIYNATVNPKNVSLNFSIAPESGASMLVNANGQKISEIRGKGGEMATISLAVPPGKMQLTFKNQSPDKVIIQNTELKVAE